MTWLGIIFKPLEAGRHRQPKGLWSKVTAALAIFTAIFEAWSLSVGELNPYIHGVIFLSLMLPIVFVTHGARPDSKEVPSLVDIILIVSSLAAGLYIFANSKYFLERWPLASPLSVLDLIFGAILVIVSFESCRRAFGAGITTVVLTMIMYALFGHLLPGAFSHSYISWQAFIDQIAFTLNGIMGSPVQTAATYIFVFVAFGIFLDACGAGEFFFRLASAAAGKTVGGQAKVTTIACGLYGMISGSPTSDTVTIGSFAIPNMKRAGYDPVYAGAVTAVAATGGAIMPPVMGAAAFLMAELTGIPYMEIVVAAIIPALFYYLGILIQIHFHTLRNNLHVVPTAESSISLKEVLKESYYMLPLLVLVVLMLKGFTPIFSGLIAIISTILVSWTRKATRMGPGKILDTIIKSGHGVAPLAAVTAAAGIVVGSIMTTGLASKFMVLIDTLSGGYITLALIVGAIVLIILGMGMPVSPVYILGAVLVAPVLIKLGFSVKLSHLFIVYFASLSAITPPVAVAAYAAGAIAKADPFAIGWRACRLGIVAYLVPFIFMFEPALVLEGNFTEVVWAVFTGIIGVTALSAGVEGWFRRKMASWERVLAVVGALLTLYPGLITDIIGFVFLGASFFRQFVVLNSVIIQTGGEEVKD